MSKTTRTEIRIRVSADSEQLIIEAIMEFEGKVDTEAVSELYALIKKEVNGE